jgi:transcriptional regulator with XRE-family HTH domain
LGPTRKAVSLQQFADRLYAADNARVMGDRLISVGQRLRTLRDQLGYTIRDGESASQRLAAKHKNDDFIIPLSRLSEIETKGTIPSIYRLYTMSVIYRRDFRELLSWYGIDVNGTASDLHLSDPPKSHKSDALQSGTEVTVPAGFDPSFDRRRTMNFGRMIQEWGTFPLAYFSNVQSEQYTYGYIGSEDFTMYPMLMPGSFVQIDEHRNEVQDGVWRSEYERPIYFVETRDGFTCCWCSVDEDRLILQPHPLSPLSPRALKQPQEAEIIGQVVGIAMKIGDWTRPWQELAPRSKASELN